jgi:predicted sulfurtransferase
MDSSANTWQSRPSKPFGLVRGESDPISYSCRCASNEKGGSVLLFYRYWSNEPKLPQELMLFASDVNALANWHREICRKYHLGGKLRIAREGFNITVAGTKENIHSYMDECSSHWSFVDLSLHTGDAKSQFFKPSNGCACVFNNVANVRVAAEITPMGVEGYLPQDWNKIESLEPKEFHQKCYEGKTLLFDARNHYESKIGYFIDPHTGDPAIRPPIRRFSQWPHYVKQHAQDIGNEKSQIMLYCTGGIRCEKAARWMQENIPESNKPKICTLKGGIAAYLAWMEVEIENRRQQPEDSLFKGRNYVFDARGSVGLPEATETVSCCHSCEQSTINLSKCQSKRCHLVLVVCLDCIHNDVRCCQDCKDIDEGEESRTSVAGARPICTCEKERESLLWGGEQRKKSKNKRRKNGTGDLAELGTRESIGIRVKILKTAA